MKDEQKGTSIKKDIMGLRTYFTSRYKTLENVVADLMPSKGKGNCYRQCAQLTEYKVGCNAANLYASRLYCKKACDFDEVSSLDACFDACLGLCYKGDIAEGWKNLQVLDRSPGHPESSATCFEACRAGCNFRWKCEGDLEDSKLE